MLCTSAAKAEVTSSNSGSLPTSVVARREWKVALVELSVVEQRYHAVMEVLAGMSVTEVAGRYGVHRNSVHEWMRRYEGGGIAALADRSHRPEHHPWQISAEIEAVICELRRAHPRWGPRRLQHELGRRGVEPLPSLSSIYRVLARNHLVAARSRKRKREDYRRWERAAPMELWQLDIKGGVMLEGGRDAKLVTGIDDHSRFCVIAQLLERATGRQVCAAFATALEKFGVPDEVLTDNGKQFTGRFGKPRAGEALFERICRDNGITVRHTAIRSPTTTGKVERFHQSLQVELLDERCPFADLDQAQGAIDSWVADYNHSRPHQALDMATPASRFRAVPQTEREALPLRLPPTLVNTPAHEPDLESAIAVAASTTIPEHAMLPNNDAIEVDRVVPASGNLKIRPQQFWLGTQLAGRTITLWIDTKTVHVNLDGQRLKTLPSRMSERDLERLRRGGARTAGPPPALPSSRRLAPGDALEVERVVNACGLVGLGGKRFGVGSPLAGQRVTLRLEGELLHVVSDGVLVRTLASPVDSDNLPRLWGARVAGPPPPPDTEPPRVRRRVSSRGAISVAAQRLQVGIVHAHRVVTVELHDDVFRVIDDNGEVLKVAPRTSKKEVIQLKAHGRDVRGGG
jgi:transposase InsO family protein